MDELEFGWFGCIIRGYHIKLGLTLTELPVNREVHSSESQINQLPHHPSFSHTTDHAHSFPSPSPFLPSSQILVSHSTAQSHTPAAPASAAAGLGPHPHQHYTGPSVHHSGRAGYKCHQLVEN